MEIGIAAGVEYIKTASGSNGTGIINMHNVLLLKEAVAGRDNMVQQFQELGYKLD